MRCSGGCCGAVAAGGGGGGDDDGRRGRGGGGSAFEEDLKRDFKDIRRLREGVALEDEGMMGGIVCGCICVLCHVSQSSNLAMVIDAIHSLPLPFPSFPSAAWAIQ